MYWFDYAIVRYMPSSIRGEIVNIGIVVFRPSGIDVKMLNSSMKARILDGESEFSDIHSLSDSFKAISQGVDDPDKQYLLLKSLDSGVFLSDRNSFSIVDLSHYDRQVSKIYSDLVKPFSSAVSSIGKSRIHTRLREKFKGMGLLARDKSEINDHKIVQNFVIDQSTGLTADFMLKNGKYHMTEAIDFNTRDTNSKFKETTLKVMSFVEGRKNLGDNVARYFVYSANSNKDRDIVPHLNLAEGYSDKLFNIESQQEKAQYFQLLSDATGEQFNF